MVAQWWVTYWDRYCHSIIKTALPSWVNRQSADTVVIIGWYRLSAEWLIIGRYWSSADYRGISNVKEFHQMDPHLYACLWVEASESQYNAISAISVRSPVQWRMKKGPVLSAPCISFSARTLFGWVAGRASSPVPISKVSLRDKLRRKPMENFLTWPRVTC